MKDYLDIVGGERGNYPLSIRRKADEIALSAGYVRADVILLGLSDHVVRTRPPRRKGGKVRVIVCVDCGAF